MRILAEIRIVKRSTNSRYRLVGAKYDTSNAVSRRHRAHIDNWEKAMFAARRNLMMGMAIGCLLVGAGGLTIHPPPVVHPSTYSTGTLCINQGYWINKGLAPAFGFSGATSGQAGVTSQTGQILNQSNGCGSIDRLNVATWAGTQSIVAYDSNGSAGVWVSDNAATPTFTYTGPTGNEWVNVSLYLSLPNGVVNSSNSIYQYGTMSCTNHYWEEGNAALNVGSALWDLNTSTIVASTVQTGVWNSGYLQCTSAASATGSGSATFVWANAPFVHGNRYNVDFDVGCQATSIIISYPSGHTGDPTGIYDQNHCTPSGGSAGYVNVDTVTYTY
jgi:hypothetical protein